MIDCHVHLGRIKYDREALTGESLLSWMNENNIDKACILPLENPSHVHYYVTTEQVLEEASRSDRLIPFCNIDPRIGADFKTKEQIVGDYVDRGAKGFGEIIVDMTIQHVKLIDLYKICGAFRLPVIIHVASRFASDNSKLEGLQEVLKSCSKTNFLLHSFGWWNDVNVIENIFKKYSNAYGDLSAKSCYDFLIKLENVEKFLSLWSSRLIFGTDYLEPGQVCTILNLFKNIYLKGDERKNIVENNILRLLRRS